MSKLIYNSKTFTVPEGSTPEETLESLKGVMPELENATLTKSGDDFQVKLNHGTKG